MINISVDKDDVQAQVEGKGRDIIAEAGVAIVNIIEIIREIKDDDKFIREIVDLAIKWEKEMKR